MLTKENLGTVIDSRGLLSEIHAFYTDLYSAETCDENAQNEFLCDAMPRLTEEESKLCEGALTEEELRKALFFLENDKSPGIDGLTANFYEYFWPLFGPSVTHVYNHAFRAGRLAVSQRRGIITLLFKKEDRTFYIIGCALLGHFSNRACDLWFLLEKQTPPCQRRHLGATPEGGWF